MQKLKFNFLKSLIFIIAVELFCLVQGVWLLIKGKGNLPIIGLMFCFALIPLAGNVLWLFRFLKGRILYHNTVLILMDGGRLIFDEPSIPYEVWLFCKIPFSRYNGQISVSNDGKAVSWTKNVPCCSPITRSFRSDCTPIILRPPYKKINRLGQCSLIFHLRPTLINTAINEIFPADDMVPITVLVKSA